MNLFRKVLIKRGLDWPIEVVEIERHIKEVKKGVSLYDCYVCEWSAELVELIDDHNAHLELARLHVKSALDGLGVIKAVGVIKEDCKINSNFKI